jgi:hypothetical protein
VPLVTLPVRVVAAGYCVAVTIGTDEPGADGPTAVPSEAVPLADGSLRLMIRWIPVGMVLMSLVLIAAIGRLALLFVSAWIVVPVSVLLGAGYLALVRGQLWRAIRIGRAPAPYLELTTDQLVVHQLALFAAAIPIPRHLVKAVCVDTSGRTYWWTDRRRFPITEPGDPHDAPTVGWLYSYRGDAALPTVTSNAQTPNLVVLLSEPHSLPADKGPAIDLNSLREDDTAHGADLAGAGSMVSGFFAVVRDPAGARVAFDRWGVLRPRLTTVDLSTAGVPFVATGRTGGLDVAEPMVRYMVRLVELLMLAVLTIVAGAVVNLGVEVGPLIWFCYEVPATALFGRTAIGWLFRIRIITTSSGRARLGLGRAVRRWLLVAVNGFFVISTQPFEVGNVLGRLAPRLDLRHGVGAGTVMVTEDEYQRLRRRPTNERVEAIHQAVRAARATDPHISRRASLVVCAILLAIVAGCISLAVVL